MSKKPEKVAVATAPAPRTEPAPEGSPPAPTPAAEVRTTQTALVTRPKLVEEGERDEIALSNSRMRIEAYKLRDEVARRKLVMAAAGEISKATWGPKLSEVAGVKLAEWCYGHGLDPMRHIFILGDKVYDAAEYYKDKLASMPEYRGHEEILIAPLAKVEDYVPKGTETLVSAHHLKKLKEEIEEQNYKRLQLAIEWGVPPDIFQFPKHAAAHLIILHFADGQDVKGVNWAGSRGRTKGQQGGSWDPVGDGEPVKTSRTRAFRAAAKDRVPFLFQRSGDGRDEALVSLEELISEGRAALKRAPEAPVNTARVQDGLQITAGRGNGAPQPEDAYAGKEAGGKGEAAETALSPAEAASEQADNEQAAWEREQQKAKEAQAAAAPASPNPADEEIAALKGQLRASMAHKCITPEDTKFYEKMMAKENVTTVQLRSWLETIQRRCAEWDAGK